jgi:hypothetical protein
MTTQPDQPARDAGGGGTAGGTPASGRAASGRPASGGASGTSAAVGTPPADTTGQGGTAQGGTGRQGEAPRGYVPRQAYGPGYREPRRSGAVLGFSVLAAVLMIVSGVFGFFEGLAAIIRGSWFVVTRNYAYGMNAASWGWIHLALGVLIAVAGVALLFDQLWARVIGVVLASLIAVANFIYIPYYPFWSIVAIALNLFIIWALLTPRRDYALRPR